MTGLLIALVKAYRLAFAPFFGPCCRFVPSCSHYAEQALRTHGPRRGLGLALRRIARCHPFARGGLDEVPETAGR